MKLLRFLFKHYIFRSTHNVENIKRIIRAYGFEIYPFRLLSKNNRNTKLLKELGAIEYAGRRSAFVATSPIVKGVFIKDDLGDDDQNCLLFQEMAHIWYDDPNVMNFSAELEFWQEERANLFLHRLRLLKTVIYGVAFILLVWMAAFLAGAFC